MIQKALLTTSVLVLGLATVASLHAQNQLQAPPCPIDGPSVADTFKYLNDAIGPVVDRTDKLPISGSHYSLSAVGDELIFSWLDQQNWKIEGHVHVNQLDCRSSVEELSPPWGRGFIVSTDCVLDYGLCFHRRFKGNDGSWVDDPVSLGGLSFPVMQDRNEAERLRKALSHLIALLQQEYKQSHSEPRNSSAKPQ